MKTFLFAWNPNKWDWEDIEQSIEQIEKTGRVNEDWSVSSHKKIRPGDRAFLVRLGKEPKGIMAAGFVGTKPFLSKHWSGENKLIYNVVIDFEVILNPECEPILNLKILNQGNLAKGHWTPQSSGIEIKPDIVYDLEQVWFEFLIKENIRNNPFTETKKEEQKVYAEGNSNQVVVTKYERNPYARETCINHYGYTCVVCDFNFEKVYGDLGKNFIHVHHLKQVATIKKEYNIDPIKDLRPVCPNCHAMIHKNPKKPYSIEEIKELIGRK
jgi:5-methylcytosine-specific restriction protein A